MLYLTGPNLACSVVLMVTIACMYDIKVVSASESIEGELVLIMEDHFDTGKHYQYFQVEDKSTGKVININASSTFTDEKGGQVKLQPLDHVKMKGNSIKAPLDFDADIAKSKSSKMFQVTDVVEVNRKLPVDQPRYRRHELGVATEQQRSVVIMRVNYNGNDPSYCSESCVTSRMWTGNRNVNGLYAESSYGLVQFDHTRSLVITVNVIGSLDTDDACRYGEIGLEADAVFNATYGFFPEEQFDHQVYYLPESITSCTFGGVAYYGCTPGRCKSWVRQHFGTNLAHELGHNLDLRHSATDLEDDGVHAASEEYGDNSCVMAASATWRAINGPHRYLAGWVPETAVYTATGAPGPMSYERTLPAVHVVPTTNASAPSLVKIARAAGGMYLVSHRGDSLYDQTMGVQWRFKVAVHYVTSHDRVNTYLVKTLSVGESAFLHEASGSNITVTVLSINPVEARIRIGVNTWQPGDVYDPYFPVPTQANCSALGWPLETGIDGHATKCAASSIDGICTQKVPYWSALRTCQVQGARLCSLEELASDVAQGSGCNLDNAQVWSSTFCANGHVVTQGQSPKTPQHLTSYPTECRPDNYTDAHVRCCSDETVDAPDLTLLCRDRLGSCQYWASIGFCNPASTYFPTMSIHCRYSCGICGTIKDGHALTSTDGTATPLATGLAVVTTAQSSSAVSTTSEVENITLVDSRDGALGNESNASTIPLTNSSSEPTPLPSTEEPTNASSSETPQHTATEDPASLSSSDAPPIVIVNTITNNTGRGADVTLLQNGGKGSDTASKEQTTEQALFLSIVIVAGVMLVGALALMLYVRQRHTKHGRETITPVSPSALRAYTITPDTAAPAARSHQHLRYFESTKEPVALQNLARSHVFVPMSHLSPARPASASPSINFSMFEEQQAHTPHSIAPVPRPSPLCQQAQV